MVKVCHLTSAHKSDDDRIFYKECSSLAAAGYETYLVVQGDSREENGVHIVGVGRAPESRLKRMTVFAREVYKKALSLDCDIYHFHDPELLPYGLKLKRRGKKVIFDSHENYPAQISGKDYIPVFVRKLIVLLYRGKETSVVRRIDAVVIPCTIDGKDIFEGRSKRTVFITNYPKDSLFYKKYDPSIEKKYDFCYVGGLTETRGVYHLVKATGENKLKLLLAGEFASQEFREKVQFLPEFENVTYLGQVPNKEVAALVQMSVAGANTLLDVGQYHHADTFGVKVYEYMSVGLPVIMADYPYARRMIEKYGFGICVKPDDPAAIAEAVCYLKDHPDEACRMGENGRRAVEDEFNWSTQEVKLLDLYRGLARHEEIF